MIDGFISAFLLLFVVVDPLGNIPLFLAITSHLPKQRLVRVVCEAVVIATCILAGFALVGTAILSYLGISFASFKVAGGLVLFRLSLEMLTAKREERRRSNVEGEGVEEPSDNATVFPLATPLLAGPSAIVSVMVVISDHADDFALQAVGGVALVSVMLASAIILSIAVTARQWINQQVMAVLSRVMAIILAAMSVQFVVDGARELGLFPGL